MDEITETLTRGVEQVFPSAEKLETVLRAGKKIRIYQGFDPTGSQLHIGHMSGIMKLRQFQKLGHEVIFLIGDVTGTIGDPSGKSEARAPLARKQVLKNAETYKQQVSQLLAFTGKNPVQIRYNSEWLDKLSYVEIIELMRQVSIPQVMKRDMFRKRIADGKDLFMNELFYPVMQGYDSVAMNVDLEVGGNDQMYNMLVGRDLMHKMKQKEKYVLTTKLLTDGSGKKIGKTEGNVIALDAKPEDLYGMIMSLPDDVIGNALECITDIPLSEIDHIKNQLTLRIEPMKHKKKLAHSVVKLLNNVEKANAAQEHFEKTVQRKEVREDISTIKWESTLSLKDNIVASGITKSVTYTKKFISQGAVELDGIKITDPNQIIATTDGMILKFGKRNYVKLISVDS